MDIYEIIQDIDDETFNRYIAYFLGFVSLEINNWLVNFL